MTITTHHDYVKQLHRASALLKAEVGTPEFDELVHIVSETKVYEDSMRDAESYKRQNAVMVDAKTKLQIAPPMKGTNRHMRRKAVKLKKQGSS